MWFIFCVDLGLSSLIFVRPPALVRLLRDLTSLFSSGHQRLELFPLAPSAEGTGAGMAHSVGLGRGAQKSSGARLEKWTRKATWDGRLVEVRPSQSGAWMRK